jgi:hypothetical protein
MKIINPNTKLPEYLVGDDNLVEDINQRRIEADRLKKEKGKLDESTETS